MSKGVKSSKSKSSSGFAKEIFGMAILLFSILSLLCIITGEVIFYNLGAYVQGFFLGLFGYFAFVVIFLAVLLGLRLLLSRSILPKQVKKILCGILFLAFFIMAIVQTAIAFEPSLSFGENFGLIYGEGLTNFQTVTPLGAVSLLIIAPIGTFATKVGTYVIFSVLILLTLLLLFKKQIAMLIKGSKNQKEKQPAKKEKPTKKDNKNNSKNGDEQVTFPTNDSNDDNEEITVQKPIRPAYFGSDDFALKTKRDYNKESRPVDVFGGEFSFISSGNTTKRSKEQDTTSSPYSTQYRRDLSPEANYIMTPKPITPDQIGQPPIRANNPATMPDMRTANAPVYDRGAMGGSVYNINDNQNGFSSPRQMENREFNNGGGLFENYNSTNNEPYGNQNLGTRGGQGSNDLFGSANMRGDDRAPYNVQSERNQEIITRLGGDRGKEPEKDGLDLAIESMITAPPENTFRSEPEMPNVDKAYNPTEHVPPTPPLFGDRNTQKPAYSTDNARPAQTNVPNMNPGYDQNSRDSFGGRVQFGQPNQYNEGDDSRQSTRFGNGERNLGDRGLGDRNVGDRGLGNRTPSTRNVGSRDDDTDLDDTNFGGRNVSDRPTFPPTPSERPTRSTQDNFNRPREDTPTPDRTAATSSTMQGKALNSDTEPVDDGSQDIEKMPLKYTYHKPKIDLLQDAKVDELGVLNERKRLAELARLVETNFAKRNVIIRLENIVYGMSVTRFEYSMPTETSVRAFTQNQGDIAVWLQAKGNIRILAPIPDTSLVGIEVPNNVRTNVSLKELISSSQFRNLKQDGIYISCGKNVMAEPVFLNLTDMPHLLIAGATGQGKSVFLNSMLVSLLYAYSPEDVRIVIVDPKKIEFLSFEGLPHLLFNKIITSAEETAALLNLLVNEMDERYNLFKIQRVKKISAYNQSIDRTTTKKLPYIIVLIDEFADLMMQNPVAKKDMDKSITRLAQLARAAGISLVFATQRPTTDVIDGTIKNNFPARICFKTADYTNSQVVLGENGAEKLLGKGDLLYKVDGSAQRAQGAYLSDDEIDRVVSYVNSANKHYYDKNFLDAISKMAQTFTNNGSNGGGGQISMDLGDSDPSESDRTYRRALRLVIVLRTTSKSMLQTKLGIGYNKAARIIDWMESQGYISPVLDNKQREIRIDREQYEQIFGEPFNEDYTKD